MASVAPAFELVSSEVAGPEPAASTGRGVVLQFPSGVRQPFTLNPPDGFFNQAEKDELSAALTYLEDRAAVSGKKLVLAQQYSAAPVPYAVLNSSSFYNQPANSPPEVLPTAPTMFPYLPREEVFMRCPGAEYASKKSIMDNQSAEHAHFADRHNPAQPSAGQLNQDHNTHPYVEGAHFSAMSKPFGPSWLGYVDVEIESGGRTTHAGRLLLRKEVDHRICAAWIAGEKDQPISEHPLFRHPEDISNSTEYALDKMTQQFTNMPRTRWLALSQSLIA